VANVARFERFFRAAANLDVDKDDLKRYSDFISDKVYDAMLIAEGNAKANDRDVLEFRGLPITKGLQQRMHEFRKMDDDVELLPIPRGDGRAPAAGCDGERGGRRTSGTARSATSTCCSRGGTP